MTRLRSEEPYSRLRSSLADLSGDRLLSANELGERLGRVLDERRS